MNQPKKWTTEEVVALYHTPLMDLLYQAATIHRQHHDPNKVQVSTLLSIKTGGCAEDCGYCPQAARYHTNVESEGLMSVQQVKAQAEAEGLDKIFIDAGFEWRLPGCSMCLAMNNDRLLPGERCAATSNRNFEGRQGRGGRTHLVSPAMAAAAAVFGHFVDIRDL